MESGPLQTPSSERSDPVERICATSSESVRAQMNEEMRVDALEARIDKEE